MKKAATILVAAILVAIPFNADAVTYGIDVAVPAYVPPGDTMFTNLHNAVPTASLTIMNADGANAVFDATWQAQSDQIRSQRDWGGYLDKSIGYVDTNYTNRSETDVKAAIDNYLKTADNKLHVDGIMFDRVTSACGTNNVNRQYYEDLQSYVHTTMAAIDPTVTPLVVDNPGVPIMDCYLASGHRTADTFITFEGSFATYTQSLLTGAAWPLGNVTDSNGTPRLGNEYNANGITYYHIVYNTPSAANMRQAVGLAWGREAGYVYVTDENLPNPYSLTPSWGFSAENSYAANTWQP